MKAHKGDQIVCECAQPAGRFDRNVEDGANVSGKDFIITLLPGDVPNGGDHWFCPTCKETVARFSGDRWRVRTRNGWLE